MAITSSIARTTENRSRVFLTLEKLVIEEMNKEYSKNLIFVRDFVFSHIPNLLIKDITVSGHEDSVVDTNGLRAMGGKILGMKNNRNGNIVICAGVSIEYSHITVINKNGEIIQQDLIKKQFEGKLMSIQVAIVVIYHSSKLHTVCKPDEIGIYDVRDGSYDRKCISDVIP